MLPIDKQKVSDLSISIELFEEEKSESLSQNIYQTLLCLLLDHTLKPGMMLNRRELADLFEVSVAPVLEALVLLERDGFIQSIPRKGTIVKTFTGNDAIDMLILREAYECQAARLYCGEPIKKHLDELMPLAIEIDSSYLDFVKNNWIPEMKFHKKLVDLSGCKVLSNMFSKSFLVATFYSSYTDYRREPNSENRSNDLHQRMLVELMKGDPDLAERVMRNHIQSTINTISDLSFS